MCVTYAFVPLLSLQPNSKVSMSFVLTSRPLLSCIRTAVCVLQGHVALSWLCPEKSAFLYHHILPKPKTNHYFVQRHTLTEVELHSKGWTTSSRTSDVGKENAHACMHLQLSMPVCILCKCVWGMCMCVSSRVYCVRAYFSFFGVCVCFQATVFMHNSLPCLWVCAHVHMRMPPCDYASAYIHFPLIFSTANRDSHFQLEMY